MTGTREEPVFVNIVWWVRSMHVRRASLYVRANNSLECAGGCAVGVAVFLLGFCFYWSFYSFKWLRVCLRRSFVF